jgi:hypothetical protein
MSQKQRGMTGNRTLDLPHAKGAHYPCAIIPNSHQLKGLHTI